MMKTATSLLMLFAVASTCKATSEQMRSPLSKVLDLMAELTAKITKEGDAEAKAYTEYFDWCDDMAKNAGFEIKTAEAKKEKLEATIGELTTAISVSTAKIDDLVAAIAADDSELKDAAAVAKNEAELLDCIDTLERAIGIISKEMAKNPAALAQIDTSSTARLVQTLGAVIDAAGFAANDKQKLVALVQSQNSDDQEEPGAPAAAVYKSHSTGIVDVLEDMKEKSRGISERFAERGDHSKHNFEMLKQSLEDQMAADSKDMEDEKAAKAEAAEGKATAEGDLAETVKLLKNTQDALATASATCMQVAADHQATVKARDEELTAIATATKILKDTTSGAASQTYSMLQVARLQSRADLAGLEVVQLVKQLAKKHHSSALAQLASRMTAAIRFGSSGGEDPFAKVKGLIENMIAKLEAEAKAEATEKAYCDEEIAKTEAKRGELMDDVSKLSAKIDQATSKSTTLSAEIKQLEAELAALMKSQAEMDKIRQEENAAFLQAKDDLTLGLSGVRQALTVLRDYYASDAALVQQPAMPALHTKASGAGTSIIGILEVVESDFATGLAKEETQEDDAKALYDDITQENKVAKTMKDQDLKYKTAEVKSLAKAVAELSSDKETLSSELAAVNEYYAKLKDRCIAKPETYEERKARREAEINGLIEALQVLESETAFVQRSKRRTHMRGALEAH